MNIIVTAGPTREYIDPVRFISNPATGKLGYLICRKARESGHRVTLITGPSFIEKPGAAEIVNVVSAVEMKNAVLECFKRSDVLIMTAAVSDWRPAKKSTHKLKRKHAWCLDLISNPDILKAVSRIKKKKQVVIGFALETSHLLENGWRKLIEKKLDLIVVNETSFLGEGDGKSAVFLLRPDKSMEDCTGFSKEKLAAQLVKKAEEIFKSKQ